MKRIYSIMVVVICLSFMIISNGCSKGTVTPTVKANTLDSALSGGSSKVWKSNSCYTSVFMFDSAVAFYKDHTYKAIPIKGKTVQSYNRTWTTSGDNLLVAQYFDSTISDSAIIDTFYITSFSSGSIEFDTIKNSFFKNVGCVPKWSAE
jgi:hypothetical protein